MSRMLLSCLALFVMYTGYTQPTLAWLKTIDSPSQTGGSVAVDRFNNSYAAAWRDNRTYVTKRDAAGNTVWAASASSSLLESVVNVFVDKDDNPVVTGFQYTTSINGIIARGLIVRKFTSSGDSVYRTIVSGLFTFIDGGDIEHPGNNQTKITAAMDSLSNVYIATAGEASAGKGFQAIKVAPGGNVEWLRVQNFNRDTTGNPFFLAANITVKNNRVGITGTTDRSLSNVSTWVLTTAGNTVWTNITPKAGGFNSDIVFDETSNAFVVTTASNAVNNTYTGGDIVIQKFNKDGKKLATKAFDFGNNELPLRILVGPDKNFVIMARADGTSPWGYFDWFIIKISNSFNILWTNRYNESVYDERPKAMVLDAKGNVYVTGTGGPETGDLYYGLFGVTIKFSPSGAKLWQSQLHLYNFTPANIALGKDTSVFVISNPGATVARFLQTGKTTNCAAPINIKAGSITNNSATITWKAVPGVFLYYLQYKTATATEWTQVTADSNRYTLQSLQQGTQYNVRVQAVCASEPSDVSATANFKTTGAGYCTSKGPDNNCQWIDGVQLGAINTYGSGPNNGYKDFTGLSASLQLGSVYTITTNKYNLCGSNESWRIWIDYNHDGDFLDANELIVQYSNNYNYDYHDFTVPSNVLTGTTRMRVSMKAGANNYSTPCEMLPDGEVEDYTVNVSSPQLFIAGTIKGMETKDDKEALTVFPNPAKSELHLSLPQIKVSGTIKVYDLQGRLVKEVIASATGSVRIDISALAPGMYMLQLKDISGSQHYKRFIKE